MPGIVDFPTVVEEAVAEFGGVFANAPERRHFGEYLTGLMVAERKNVSAINAEFVETTDQSCLNRWITQVRWDGKWLNEHRLEWLQERPSTRYSGRGVRQHLGRPQRRQDRGRGLVLGSLRPAL